jgi:hypothetical protein
MGKIFWTPSGPVEIQPWGGTKKVPRNDPRVADDDRWTITDVTTRDEFGDMEDDSPPDLGELIPGNNLNDTTDTGGAQVGERRDREGTMTDPGNRGTRDGDDVNMEAARIGSGGGPGGGVSKETPVSPYPSLSYGLQETHTTVLPWVGWCAAAGLDNATPLQLRLRMNAPYDFLDMTTSPNPAADGAVIATKGFYATKVDGVGRYTNTTGNPAFPVQFGANATTANERPQWREYWAKLYDYYTVLGCEYEIHLYNPVQMKQSRLITYPTKTIAAVTYPSVMYREEGGFYNTDVVIATQFDTYSDTATSTGNVMPQANYEEMRAFKNINWTPVEGGRKAVIRGTYKPGQAARNIVNDGDVKTWTATGAALPNLKEILTLNFFTDPFYNARDKDFYITAGSTEISGTGSQMFGAVNMEIKLKWIVQFKDLKQQARYPNTLVTDQDITQILNESIASSGSALMSWTTAST